MGEPLRPSQKKHSKSIRIINAILFLCCGPSPPANLPALLLWLYLFWNTPCTAAVSNFGSGWQTDRKIKTPGGPPLHYPASRQSLERGSNSLLPPTIVRGRHSQGLGIERRIREQEAIIDQGIGTRHLFGCDFYFRWSK